MIGSGQLGLSRDAGIAYYGGRHVKLRMH